MDTTSYCPFHCAGWAVDRAEAWGWTAGAGAIWLTYFVGAGASRPINYRHPVQNGPAVRQTEPVR